MRVQSSLTVHFDMSNAVWRFTSSGPSDSPIPSQPTHFEAAVIGYIVLVGIFLICRVTTVAPLCSRMIDGALNGIITSE